MKISIIICHNDKANLDALIENLKIKTQGFNDLDIVIIDNKDNKYGICEAYNKGIEEAEGDILCFCHEDILFETVKWDLVLKEKFKNLKNIKLLGVAGSAGLGVIPLWSVSGSFLGVHSPFGKVVHQTKDRKFRSNFNVLEGDFEVLVLDGLFIAGKKELFQKIKFDQYAFPKFHFYDIDISLQAAKLGKNYVTTDLEIIHKSSGNMNQEFYYAMGNFVKKYDFKDKMILPCFRTLPGSRSFEEEI